MNPITRMMKRYINMPMKKALPLLFICAILLVSITGCTSSTNTRSSSGGGSPSATVATRTPIATSTPTATPKSTATPTPTVAQRQAPTPTPSGPCNCYGPDLDCKDFPTQGQAQACYNYCKSLTGRDVFGLDRDNDGIACEK
jgi:hypothetical protein